MSNVSYKSCTLIWYAKKKSIYMKHLYLLSQFFFSFGFPNFGTQIRCMENR